MAQVDSTARIHVANSAAVYRSAPHNVEVEQALIGAILVNNEAFYRISDFLSATHFYEPIHQKIFELASSLIRAGKVATPLTLKTFLPDNVTIGTLTLPQYLARLAAEATTVINAEDYGRTIYDLSIRRDLIRIGEDIVNVAYEAPVDAVPRDQIEDAERRLYGSPRPATTAAGSNDSRRRSPPPSTWRRAPISATANCRAWRPGCATSMRRWAACNPPTSSSSPAAQAWARRRLPPTSRTTSPGPGAARCAPTATCRP